MVLRLDELPDDIIKIIIKDLVLNDKENIRRVNKELKRFINVMDLRVEKFEYLYRDILIPFSIFDEKTKYIQLGLIIEWQSRFFCINCLNSVECNCRRMGVNRYEIIRSYIMDYIINKGNRGKTGHIWFLESILDWAVLETEGIRKLRI